MILQRIESASFLDLIDNTKLRPLTGMDRIQIPELYTNIPDLPGRKIKDSTEIVI